MGGWEHFSKMPNGVKILLVWALWGVLNAINSVVGIFSTFASSAGTLVLAVLSLVGLALFAVQLFGVWGAKKGLANVYLAMIVLVVLNFFVFPALFPDVVLENTRNEISKISELSTLSPQVKELTAKAMITALPYIALVHILLNLVFWWYSKKQKDHFRE